MRRPLLNRLGLALVCLLAPFAARAQEEGDIDLIKSQSGAPPNLMILFDTSENMRNVVWSSDFNPVLFYDGTGAAKFCTNLTVPARVGTDGDCPEGNGPNGKCPDNSGAGNYRLAGEEVQCRKNDFAQGCTGWTIGACRIVTGGGSNAIYFTLPNYSPTPYTARWSKNYLAFLVNYYSSNNKLPTDFPREVRLVTARNAIKDVIEAVNPTRANGTSEDNVRFGLARFDTDFANLALEPIPTPPAADTDARADSNNDGHGGYVVVPPASGNKAQLFAGLDALVAIDYTPLSEALVDVGRYFLGTHLQPDGTQGLGSYPVYDRDTKTGATTLSPPASPIDPKVSCQKNFVVVVTSGDPESDENDEFNGNSVFNDTFSNDYDDDNQDPGPVHTRDFLDDIALFLNKQRKDDADHKLPIDLDRDLVSNDEMVKDQNIVTYVIGFSFRSDLLQRSGVKGGGGYFTTHTRAGLVDVLVTAIDDILLRSATFTAATVPTSRQSFGNAFFVTFLEPRPEGDLWVGHLQAFTLSENFEIVGTTGPALDPTTGQFLEPRFPFWDSQTALHDPNLTRNLLTTKTPSRVFTAANIAAADLSVTSADLSLYPNDPAVPFTSTETLTDSIVNWIHGRDTFDKDRDTNATELREAVLGDIFHSNPLAIAGPPPFLSGEPGFGPPTDPNSFFVRYAQRQRVIYAGANDGMLHGFNAGSLVFADNPDTTATESEYYSIGTGKELFGYIPKFLLPHLKEMPQRRDKPFYVDGTPSVADAWLPSSSTDTTKGSSEWATTLVVGMRNGEDGYLALDVTDPNATTSPHGPYPKLLWELSDPNEAFGRTWSEPVIARVKIAAGVSGDFCGTANGEGASTSFPSGNCREQWVAIVGGGFREAANPNQVSYVSDPNSATWSDDSKSIYIVRMDTGAVLAKASYTATDAQLKEMKFAIPSQPAVVDLNFDGFADLIYIGDLGGQVWKWDISALATPGATSGRVSLSTWPVGRFFAAPRAANGHYRSLFSPPSVGLINSKVTLAFGTGERTDIQYATTTGVDENRFYVISDPNALGSSAVPTTPYSESNLTNLTNSTTDPNLSDLGYYLIGGVDEKFLTDPVIFSGFVITSSYTPDQAGSATLCMARGDAKLYVFAVANGDGFFADTSIPNDARRLSIGGGLPTSPTVVQANMTSTRIVVQTSDGKVLTPEGPAAPNTGSQVIYWREVF